jgi:hypothetical protein
MGVHVRPLLLFLGHQDDRHILAVAYRTLHVDKLCVMISVVITLSVLCALDRKLMLGPFGGDWDLKLHCVASELAEHGEVFLWRLVFHNFIIQTAQSIH